jgi:hypothetical protein
MEDLERDLPALFVLCQEHPRRAPAPDLPFHGIAVAQGLAYEGQHVAPDGRSSLPGDPENVERKVDLGKR